MALTYASTSHSLSSISSSFPTSHPHRPHAPSTFRCRSIPTITASCASTAEAPRPLVASSNGSNSLYEVLGIRMGATCQEIKTAYRRLARAVHPDVSASNGQNNGDFGREFIKVHEAYATLSDPEKRADYDRMLLFTRRRPMSPPPYAAAVKGGGGGGSGLGSASGFRVYNTRRKWETDQCW